MEKDFTPPTISVVMSCYNAEKYLKESIESVLTQTFHDFEFIIWDDGSTDGTKNIIQSFNDERIRYFFHSNSGLGKALKMACAEANGKYIARMDADDYCYPDRFELEVDFLENNKDYVLVSSAVDYMNKEGAIIGRSFPCSNSKVLQKILSYDSMIVHPMVMMRRVAYEAAGGYVPLRAFEDRLFWGRIAKFGKFSNISSPLGKYRLLSNSLGHSRTLYDKVLFELRNKMMKDDVVLDFDVDTFNMIYQYSKSFINHDTLERTEGRKSFEERLYCFLRPFLGQRKAETLIVECKNLYYRYKLHV